MIIFADGTYIELINFFAPPKEFFDWAPKSPGLIDFALTGPASAQETHASVTKRLESAGDGGLGIRFKEPLGGGRRRKDGQLVEWFVTKPRFGDGVNVPKPAERYFVKGRLDTFFFCHDVTRRELRVPYDDSLISTHPSGAKGIAGVEVLVPREAVEHYAELYAAVLGVQGVEVDGGVKFQLGVPNEEALEGIKGRVGVEIHGPRDDTDEVWLKNRGIGIRRLNLYAPGDVENGIKDGALDADGIGSSISFITK